MSMDSVDHANYVLFLNRQAVGVIEAKKQGTTLHGPPQAAARVQRAGAAAPADRHLLRAAREVQRVVLRAQTWLRDPGTKDPLIYDPPLKDLQAAQSGGGDTEGD
jgi:type I site-specific restriction endonuclease